MTLDNLSRLWISLVLVWLGLCGMVPTASQGGLFGSLERRYGPTAPSGYYVRLAPSAITMPHTQQPQLTVTVEDATGQPVDEVLVNFVPSAGQITTATSRTRGGVVTGTYRAPMGSDSPRTTFVIVTVEDVEITVFIDIVPAVFGR